MVLNEDDKQATGIGKIRYFRKYIWQNKSLRSKPYRCKFYMDSFHQSAKKIQNIKDSSENFIHR